MPSKKSVEEDSEGPEHRHGEDARRVGFIFWSRQ